MLVIAGSSGLQHCSGVFEIFITMLRKVGGQGLDFYREFSTKE